MTHAPDPRNEPAAPGVRGPLSATVLDAPTAWPPRCPGAGVGRAHPHGEELHRARPSASRRRGSRVPGASETARHADSRRATPRSGRARRTARTSLEDHLLSAWRSGRTSLRDPTPGPPRTTEEGRSL